MKNVPFLTEAKIQNIIYTQLSVAYPHGISFPFDVEEFAEVKLELPIEIRDTPDGILGWANITEKTICLSSSLESNEQRLRFTLAHEIGHHSLHRKFVHGDGKFLDEKKNFAQFYAHNQNRVEIQANLYAANLLIPERYIIDVCENISRKPYSNLPFPYKLVAKTVSQQCHVSLECARIRVESVIKNTFFTEEFYEKFGIPSPYFF